MSDYIELVPADLRGEFRHFVETGEATQGFLKQLTENASLRKAADLAFAEQIDEFVREAPIPALPASAVVPPTPAVVAPPQVEALVQTVEARASQLPPKDRKQAAEAIAKLRALGIV